MHKVLELQGHQPGQTVKRFYSPEKKKMMVKLQPGEVYVTSDDELIATGLGSCVSACIWDPFIEIGGMNHFMLPLGDAEDMENWTPGQFVSKAARYGNYAMELLINTLIQNGAIKSRLKVKVFGGGQVMGKHAAIGNKNIAFIRGYLESEGLHVVSEDLGSPFPRKVLFDPKTGKAWVKKLRSYYKDVEAVEESYNARLIRDSQSQESADVELF